MLYFVVVVVLDSELGAELLRRNISLVYGGGTVGLMGIIATSVNNGTRAFHPLFRANLTLGPMMIGWLIGGGKVTGIIPRSLTPREVAGDTIGNTRFICSVSFLFVLCSSHSSCHEMALIGTTIMVNTMHKRKQLMFLQCDAFIVLPGGFGTFEELFEMVCSTVAVSLS
jgi:uncharacterized protein (TIGR00730 family)